MKGDIQKLEAIAKELFALLGVDVSLQVSETEDGDILLNLDAENNKGLLIGKRGESLSAIRFFLQQALYKETGNWRYIKVTAGDWLRKQEEYLLPLAERAAQKAKETGQPQQLYNLSPEQRRIIHMAISKMDGVTSESIGEGRERCLVIKPDDKEKTPENS